VATVTQESRVSSLAGPLLALVALVVTAAALVVFLLPLARCPECLGRGLEAEPPGRWRTGKWLAREQLVPFECPTCSDHRKVSLFRKWILPEERIVLVPVYRRGDSSHLEGQQRGILKDLCREVLRGVGDDESDAESSRPDLFPELDAALGCDLPGVPLEASSALAKANHPDAVPFLLHALRHPEHSVRSSACRGLGRLGRREPLRALVVRALKPLVDPAREWSSDVRFRAARALFDLGDLHEPGVLLETLNEASLRDEVVTRALIQFDCKQAILKLIKAMATFPPNSVPGGRHVREALESLSGEHLGDDPVAWYRWFDRNRGSLPPQVE